MPLKPGFHSALPPGCLHQAEAEARTERPQIAPVQAAD